jgi:hypothetical protein
LPAHAEGETVAPAITLPAHAEGGAVAPAVEFSM